MGEKSRVKIWAKRIVFGLVGLILLMVLVIGGILGLVQTESGRRWAADFISRQASSEDFTLQLTGLGPGLPWKITLADVTLADGEGIWFSGRNVAVECKLSELIHGRFRFPDVKIKELVFFRAPRGQADQETEPVKLSDISFPNAAVESMTLERVTLERPFMAEPKSFSLSGQTLSAADFLSIDWNIRRLDGPPDELSIQSSFEIGSGVLTIKSFLDESPGGIVGELIGLPEPAPIKAELNGSGPITDWPGRIKFVVAGQTTAEASLHLAAGRETSFKLKGMFRAEKGIIPAQAEAYLGREAEYNVKLRMQTGDKDFRVFIDELMVSTPKAWVDLRGNADFGTGKIQGAFKVEALDLSHLSAQTGLRLEDGRIVNGRLSGTLYDPMVELDTQLGPARYDRIHLEDAQLVMRLSPQAFFAHGFRTDGKAVLKNLIFAETGLAPQDLDVRFDMRLDKEGTLSFKHLDVDGHELKIRTAGDLNPASLEMNYKADVEIMDIGPWAAVSGLNLSGRAALETHLSGNIKKGLIIEANGGFNDLDGLPREAAVLMGPAPTWSGKALYREAVLAISEFGLKGKSLLDVDGIVDLKQARLNLDWRSRLFGLSQLAGGADLKISDPATIDGNLTGAFDNLSLKAEATVSELSSGKQKFSDLKAKADFSGLPADIRGQVDITALHQGKRLSARSNMAYKKDRLALSKLDVQGPAVKLAGELAITASNRLVDGRADLTSDDLAQIGNLIGLKLAGSTKLNIQMESKGNQQALTLDGTGRGIGWADLRVDSLNLKVKTQNLRKLAGLEGQVQIRGFRQGKLNVSQADVKATGLADGVRVSVRAAGEMSEPMNVDLAGKITGKAGPASPDRIVLESLKGQYGQLPFSQSQALTWERTADGWRVEGLNLAVASGRIRGKGAVAAKTVSFEVTADKLSLGSVTSQNSVGLTGVLDGRVTISGDPVTPDLKSNLHVSNLKAKDAEADGVPPAEVDLDLTVSRGQLTTKVKVGGFGPQPGTIEIAFPVKFSFKPMAMSVPAGASLSGKLDAQLNLGLLPGILGLDAQTLTGLARVAMKVGGSMSSPNTSGQVVISDAQYENIRYGIILQDINAEVAANGDSLEIRQATASDGEQGKISVRGKMTLDSKRGFPFSWQVDLDKAQCVRQDLATATTSGSLDLSGTVSEAKLSGKIVLDPAEVNIPKRMPASITDLEIIEKNAPASDKEKEKKPAKNGFNLALDVNVEMPGRVFIRGQDLDTEWKGALDIGGTAAKPAILGKMEVVRGRYDILSKRFRFTQGTVTFNGSAPPAPYVDVVAENQAKDITAQIHITGLVNDLELELESDPSLPQDEILARVLFGKELSQVSPIQALSLAKAAADLTGGLGILGGKGGGLNVMEKTRKLLELDQLEIKTGASGDTAVSAGKYLSEKVYVEAEGGAKPEDQKVSIEIELTPNLSLESEIGADSQGGVGINWKLDY